VRRFNNSISAQISCGYLIVFYISLNKKKNVGWEQRITFMEATVTTANVKNLGGGDRTNGTSYGKLMMWFFIVSDALTFSGFWQPTVF
jgi:hypothetical protein